MSSEYSLDTKSFHSTARRRRTYQSPYQTYDAGRRGGRYEPASRHYMRHIYQSLGLNKNQEVILLVIAVILLLAWFLTPLSDAIAGIVLFTVPLSSDVDLGYQSLRYLEKKYPPIQYDTTWNHKIEAIGLELVHGSKNYLKRYNPTHDYIDKLKQYDWSFGVVRADFANAFALPGGAIRVTDTLLRQLNLKNDEIAALIGHEMGHVLNRHSMRRMIKSKLFSTVLEALVYNDDDARDETFGEAIGEILLNTASYLGEMGFSRRDEYEADATSWDILVMNTIRPRSLSSLLQKLWDYEGGSGETSWESTHPGTKDRILALEKKWNEMTWKEKQNLKYR